MAALLATILSGVLYAASFPPLGLSGLAACALVPWLVVMRRGTTTGRVVLLAWVWSLVAAWGLNAWFPRAVSTYYLQPVWVGWAFFVGVTTLTAAPAFVAFALVWRRLDARRSLARPLLAAAAWAGAELARTRLLGDPWGLLGYSQAARPVLLQVAEATGVYGVSFVLAAVNVALADLYLAAARRHPRAALPGIATATALAGLVVLSGAARIHAVEGRTSAETPVAVVQANLDLGSQWRPEFYGRNLEAYLRLTAEALESRPDVGLVIWPESAMTFFLDDEPTYRAAIAHVLAPHDAELVAGGPRTARGDAPPYHNTVFLLTPAGEIASWYDKRRLLPFAEYFPFGRLDVLRRSFGRVREFTPGAPTPPLPTRAGRAGVVLCNEALFGAPARGRVRAGAEILLALTNDSWVGDPTFAAQALDMTIVRAVETRRWLVRASTAGPSAVVAPTGRMVARSSHGAATVLHATVGRATGLTPYARVGDAFALACALAALVASVLRPPPAPPTDRGR